MARRKGVSPTLAGPGVKELKKSVKRTQALMDEAPIGICNVDLTGKVTYVNRRFEEVSGYSREEVVGKNGFKLGMFSREALKLLAKRIKDRLMGKPPRLLEMQFKCKDGHWIWIALEGRIMRENGIPVGFQISSRDITERRQAEEALRESEEKLRQMFESVTDGISVIDLGGTIAEVNQRTVELHGFASRDKLLGKGALELVAPRDHAKIAANMQKALKQGIVKGVEYTLLKADGAEFPGELSTSVLRDASGRWVGHITIARDITERKKAEQALERQQAYFQQLFDNSPDAIAWLDTANRFVNVNKGFETLFGYRLEEIKGRLISDTLVPEDRKEEVASLSQSQSSYEAVRMETVRKHKDGSVVTVSLLAYPILFDDKAVGSYIIYTDITERKRAEKELKEAQERLIRSEKLAAIGQLASGVGHELRNPLGAIKNAVLYVRRKVSKSELSASEPKTLEFLDIIDGEVDSANKVITDLLSFSRVAKPIVSLINVGSIIKDALGHVALPENIKVSVDVNPALLMVMVDATQIRQVFINIVLNAAEAMPEGGHLEIKARNKAEFVAVEFTDTGCGIPESVADKIFDPLFTTKPRGVGLGLAMCRSIVERHGGDIGVKSKEGKGTIFTVSLPIRVV